MSEPSPETHVFVGMFRPTPEQFEREHFSGLEHSDWRDVAAYKERAWKEWQDGFWDTPVYKTIEEVVRMRADGDGQAAR